MIRELSAIDEIILHTSDSYVSTTMLEITGWHTRDKPPEGVVVTAKNGHLYGNGWDDNAYHFGIEENGGIAAGRPIEVVGAHCRGHNKTSIGVVIMGGRDKNWVQVQNFTPVQWEALPGLIAGLQKEYSILDKDIRGHYEYDPEKKSFCPGFDVPVWMRSRQSYT